MVYARFVFIISIGFILCQCDTDSTTNKVGEDTAIVQSMYGTTIVGEKVDKYLLRNDNGMEISVITYGGIITDWTAPNSKGDYENIVLGFDSLAPYETGSPYFGALIGRYSNRIAMGSFSLDGKEYELATNNNANHLHGGTKGYDKVVWTAEAIERKNEPSLKLSYISKDGEEGYPGNLSINVFYTLTNENELRVKYSATTDQKTVVNLTQHSYFNLTGDFSKKILDHEVMIAADTYLPVDAGLIPTGEYAKVEGTPFDFRTPKAIGLDLGVENSQLETGRGYDHNWVLNGESEMRKVASAYDPTSGRLLEISTTEPGVQFYIGNFLNGSIAKPGGGTYGKHTGFCMETQHFPDSPNQKNFPSPVLDVGERYESETRFKFSVK